MHCSAGKHGVKRISVSHRLPLQAGNDVSCDRQVSQNALGSSSGTIWKIPVPKSRGNSLGHLENFPEVSIHFHQRGRKPFRMILIVSCTQFHSFSHGE